MSVQVRIPTPLRKFTGDQEVVEADGSNVREVVENLVATYPDLGQQILDQNGDVRRFVNLFLNDRDVRFQGGPDAEVNSGDELSIIPAIAGGHYTL